VSGASTRASTVVAACDLTVAADVTRRVGFRRANGSTHSTDADYRGARRPSTTPVRHHHRRHWWCGWIIVWWWRWRCQHQWRRRSSGGVAAASQRHRQAAVRVHPPVAVPGGVWSEGGAGVAVCAVSGVPRHVGRMDRRCACRHRTPATRRTPLLAVGRGPVAVPGERHERCCRVLRELDVQPARSGAGVGGGEGGRRPPRRR
jgi:hypothetical protein